jgi:NhaP-type Na+/H+ or K+/H+ antiporter
VLAWSRISSRRFCGYRLEDFAGQVAEIAVLLVFVTLGINLPFDALGEYFVGGLLVMAVFIFVARPVTVLACARTGGGAGRVMGSSS